MTAYHCQRLLPASYQGAVFANSDPRVADIKRREATAEPQCRKLDLIRKLDQKTLKHYDHE